VADTGDGHRLLQNGVAEACTAESAPKEENGRGGLQLFQCRSPVTFAPVARSGPVSGMVASSRSSTGHRSLSIWMRRAQLSCSARQLHHTKRDPRIRLVW